MVPGNILLTLHCRAIHDDDILTMVDIFPSKCAEIVSRIYDFYPLVAAGLALLPNYKTVLYKKRIHVYLCLSLDFLQILKVHKNGTMFLQDVVSAKTLCEISLPSTHELTTPWQPVLSVSAYGQMLYIKGLWLS